MLTEGAGVDAGEHHLFGAGGCNLTCHVDGFGHGGAARAAAGERNGAVGAEVVAAVLDFEECAGSVGVREGELEAFGFRLNDVDVSSFASKQVFHVVQQVVLLVVAEDDVDPFDFLDFSRRILGETADDGHNGVGVERCGLADGVAAFLFGNGGDGASVDDIEVGFLVEIDGCPTCIVEFAEQVRGLCEIEFAPQGVCGDGFHVRCLHLLNCCIFGRETQESLFSYFIRQKWAFFVSFLGPKNGKNQAVLRIFCS